MSERSLPAEAVDRFLPLTARDFHILFVLLDGDRHGYWMVTEIEKQTGGKIRMEAGNLYRSIRRKIRDGLIAEAERRPAPESDDERRRYYRITDLGRRVVAAEMARMRAVLAAADAKVELHESEVGA